MRLRSRLEQISSKGLIYEKDNTGGILFKDEKTGELLIYFNKPYAEDSDGIINEQVNVDIQKFLGTERIVITVDDVWLRNAKYPIIIDPNLEVFVQPVSTADEDTNSQDTYISSTNSGTSYYNTTYLRAGQLWSYGITRSLVKFKYLPSLPPSTSIVSAYLGVYMYLAVSPDGTIINAQQITSDWQSSTTTYFNQPTFSPSILDSIDGTQNSEWLFDITGLVKGWYSSTTANYGVILKAHDESKPLRAFYSGNNTSNQPRLIINYSVDPLGMESYWGY